MALDGAFLHHLKAELKSALLHCRVEKIYQPAKEEIVLSMRGTGGAHKLLLSSRANSPRAALTAYAPENPQTPPMLCMLLRKRLSGAKLKDIRQPNLERMLCFDFDATNELGDRVVLTLVIEIMGKYSNVILTEEDGKIIDALKRVDMTMSSQRLVLPGIPYQMPPAQNKFCFLQTDIQDILAYIYKQENTLPLSRALLNHIQGLSPIVCRELAHLSCRGTDPAVQSMMPEHRQRLQFFLSRTVQSVQNTSGAPYMVNRPDGKPLDFSFMNIVQYGTAASIKRYESFSQLLDSFYYERDRAERMRTKAQDLLKVLTNASDRLARKINAQKAELSQCADRETLRIYGDLIQANLYKIEKGAPFAELENFYGEQGSTLRVKLNPALSPAQNAQKYYKDYRKAKTAEQVLQVQIEKAQQELLYIDTVFEALSRAGTERELAEIRQELMEQGYIRRSKEKQKTAALPPLCFVSSGGFQILVGRNNRQNDALTLKTAGNNDIWLHTKNIPGSHTVIVTETRTPDEQTLLEAAQLAAFHSRARDGAQVPVDYTQIRYVSKPSGAKPGMVIYKNNKTLYVAPCIPQSVQMQHGQG